DEVPDPFRSRSFLRLVTYFGAVASGRSAVRGGAAAKFGKCGPSAARAQRPAGKRSARAEVERRSVPSDVIWTGTEGGGRKREQSGLYRSPTTASGRASGRLGI